MTEGKEDRDVPSWDGDIEKWERYKLQVHYYLKQAPYWKRSYQIAKLVRALKGKCWSLVEKLPEKSREQLEKSEDVFLAFLKKHLLEGEIPELGRIFRLYLSFRRQKKESMVLYTLRHRELLTKLGKNMKSVQGNDLQKYLEKELEEVGYEEPVADWEGAHPGMNGEDGDPPRRTWGKKKDRDPCDDASVASKTSRVSESKKSHKSESGSAKDGW